MKNDKIWNTRLDIPLKSSRLVRRVIIDEKLNAGWPFKCGGLWDIFINKKPVQTGLRTLDWTGRQWIEFINKNQ